VGVGGWECSNTSGRQGTQTERRWKAGEMDTACCVCVVVDTDGDAVPVRRWQHRGRGCARRPQPARKRQTPNAADAPDGCGGGSESGGDGRGGSRRLALLGALTPFLQHPRKGAADVASPPRVAVNGAPPRPPSRRRSTMTRTAAGREAVAADDNKARRVGRAGGCAVPRHAPRPLHHGCAHRCRARPADARCEDAAANGVDAGGRPWPGCCRTPTPCAAAACCKAWCSWLSS